jgi:hypothetical protein
MASSPVSSSSQGLSQPITPSNYEQETPPKFDPHPDCSICHEIVRCQWMSVRGRFERENSLGVKTGVHLGSSTDHAPHAPKRKHLLCVIPASISVSGICPCVYQLTSSPRIFRFVNQNKILLVHCVNFFCVSLAGYISLLAEGNQIWNFSCIFALYNGVPVKSSDVYLNRIPGAHRSNFLLSRIVASLYQFCHRYSLKWDPLNQAYLAASETTNLVPVWKLLHSHPVFDCSMSREDAWCLPRIPRA